MEVIKKKKLDELNKIFLTIIRKILHFELQLLWSFSVVSLSILESNGRISADLPHISLDFVQLIQQ